jgi:hypothetical protein
MRRCASLLRGRPLRTSAISTMGLMIRTVPYHDKEAPESFRYGPFCIWADMR